MPKPVRRKGAKTYEVRVRVPPEAHGGRFNGTHNSRTLSTPDRKADNEADANRNLPVVYDALVAEFEAEAAKLAGSAQTCVKSIADAPLATIDEVYRRYRKYILHGEQQERFLTYLEKSSIGRVQDRGQAIRALCSPSSFLSALR
jgi:hypothetical protein